VRDDQGLGENFKTVMHPSPDECELIAEALYDHEVNVLQAGKHDGWAPRSEKAFWKGCV
jgi:hypothetical protein